METSTNTASFNEGSVEQCILDCLTCYNECMKCILHCLDHGGEHAERTHMTLMMECAEICSMSAKLLRLNGRFSFEHCQLSAKVCDACANSCLALDPDDAVMQRCALSCRGCADSCRSMTQK